MDKSMTSFLHQADLKNIYLYMKSRIVKELQREGAICLYYWIPAFENAYSLHLLPAIKVDFFTLLSLNPLHHCHDN